KPDEKLKPGAHVVVLYNGIASTQDDAPEPVDSLSVINLGEHLERMTPQDLRKLGPGVRQDVLRSVVELATEIGREGREGQPIGTAVPRGFGSRHRAAAGISKRTKGIAFCVSQSSGTVRVFQDGEERLRIEPLDRPHVWQPPRLETQDEDGEENGEA